MGFWLASKARTNAFQIGKPLLDHWSRSGTPVRSIFASTYHAVFLFKLLEALTLVQMPKVDEKNVSDLSGGVALALDDLAKRYCGKPDELRAAFLVDDDHVAVRKAQDDFKLFTSVIGGDETSKARFNSLIDKHPLYGDKNKRQELEPVGLNLGSDGSLAFCILFFETIPRGDAPASSALTA